MAPKKDLHTVTVGKVEKVRKSAANVRHKTWDLEAIKTRVVKQFEGWASSKRLGTAAGDRAIQYVVSETKAKAGSFVSQGHQHALKVLAALPATLLLQSKHEPPESWVDTFSFSSEGLASCLDDLAKFGTEAVKQCAANTSAEELQADRLFYERFAQTMQDKFKQGWRLNTLLEAFGSVTRFPEASTPTTLPACNVPPQPGTVSMPMIQALSALAGLITPGKAAVATGSGNAASGNHASASMTSTPGAPQPMDTTPHAQQPNTAEPSIDATLQASPATKATAPPVVTPIAHPYSQTQFFPGISNPTPANTPASTSRPTFPFLANVPPISAPTPAVTSPPLRVSQVVKALALPPSIVDPTLRERLQQLVPQVLPSPEAALTAIREARLTLPETTNLMTAAPIGSALQIVAADCLNTMLRVQALMANEISRQQAPQQAKQGQAKQGIQAASGSAKMDQPTKPAPGAENPAGEACNTAKSEGVSDKAPETTPTKHESPKTASADAGTEPSAEAMQEKDAA